MLRQGATRLVLLLGLAATASAQQGEFVAPYVNSTREDVALMLELAEVGAGDYLIDLGSGDGRIVIDAALRGAMGHGVELDPQLVALARRRARTAEVGDVVAFQQGDVFEADFRRASVVTVYLMAEANLELRPRLLSELAPGSRIVSNSFDMGEWQPDRHEYARSSGGIMLWVVPARVAGGWTLDLGDESFALDLTQRFQNFDASLARAGSALHVLDTRLAGERIAFMAGDGHRRYAFSGRVSGETMSGLVQIHAVDGTRVEHWQARRTRNATPGDPSQAPTP